MVVTSFLRTPKPLGIRRAVEGDAEPLRELHARSLRQLAVGHYHASQVEAMIAAGTLDDTLIADGHYFIAEMRGDIVGCVGWSLRLPGYLAHGVDDQPERAKPASADEQAEVPRLRALYVDPLHTRRGVARRLVHYAEADMMAAGYPLVSLDAMLSAVDLYRALGYRTVSHGMSTLLDNVAFRYVHMRKWLDVAIAAHA